MSSPVVNPNFNGTTPAAPSGQQLAQWQVDALNPADISAYTRNTGGVDPRTTATEFITLVDQGKLVTVNVNSTVANVVVNVVALPSTFTCAVENIGTGSSSIKVNASSGQTNGSASGVQLGAGASAVLYYDGSNLWVLVGNSANTSLVVGFVINNGAAGNNVGAMLVAPRASSISKCVIVTKASDGVTGLTFRIKKNGVDIFTADPTVAAGTATGTVSSSTAFTAIPLPVAASDVFQIDILSGTPNWAFTAQLET